MSHLLLTDGFLTPDRVQVGYVGNVCSVSAAGLTVKRAAAREHRQALYRVRMLSWMSWFMRSWLKGMLP